MNLEKNTKIALDLLTKSGFKAGVVGGCVRDFLMKKQPHDYDLTTNARPEEIKEVFNKYKIIDTGGEKHGTIVVLINKETIEITTFRIDGIYTDGRRPDSVSFTNDLEEDLLRRDFTMNAIFYDGTKFIDPFEGKIDILKKKIKAVGNPDDRFKEDSLRILRALRFSSKLGFEIEEKTKEAMFRNKSLLKSVSKERISSEFVKIMKGKYATRVLKEYVNIIIEFIPELESLIKYEQHNKYHIYDIWEHTIESIKYLDDCFKNKKINKEQLLMYRFVILFHDIGKPKAKGLNSLGEFNYHNHSLYSYEMAISIFNNLKITNAEDITSVLLNKILLLIKHHDKEIYNNPIKIVKFIKEKFKGDIDLFYDLIFIKESDDFSKNPIYTKDRFKDYENIRNTYLDLKNNNKFIVNVSDLNINGKDLIDLGLKGIEIGNMLNKLLEDVSVWNIDNTKEALLKSVKRRLS